jgi:hypothetical protein
MRIAPGSRLLVVTADGDADMSEANHYIDTTDQEIEYREPISYPGVKLSASQHPWYEELRGESYPKHVPDKPKELRRLPASMRECCDHPGTDRDESW